MLPTPTDKDPAAPSTSKNNNNPPKPTTLPPPPHPPSNSLPTPIPPPTLPTPTFKAVIIRCPSTAYPVPPSRIYQTLTIPSLETQLHANDPDLPIPTFIGLPLWTRSHSWVGTCGLALKPCSEGVIENVHARALWLDGDAGSAGFGSVVRGDRVVARRDGRDLWCQHLVCLGAFCEAVVEEFGRREEEEKGNGVGGSGARRSAGRKNVKVGEGMAERRMRFRRLACREEFELYWERWCQKKLGTTGLEEYSRMKGPYDM